VNVALHAGVAAFVALLTRRLTGGAAGLLAGLLFAAHPVHVEAVAYLVGRAETLCALFALSALYLFARQPLTLGRAFGVYACAVASACSKEQGLLVPVLLAAMWPVVRRDLDPREQRPLLTLGLLTAWTWAAYILYRDHILPWFWDAYFLDQAINPLARATGADRLLVPIALIGRCAALLLAPLKLSPDYGASVTSPHQSPADPYLYVGVAALIAYTASLLYARRRRNRFALFCLIATAVAWLPVSNFIRIGTIFGERLTYLPSAFALMGLAYLASRLPVRIMIPLTSVVIALFSIRTVTYAHRWNDRESFYAASVADQPKSAHLRILLVDEIQAGARAAAAKGDRATEVSLLTRADRLLAEGRQLVPDYYKIWTESAETAMGLGRLDDATMFARRAADIDPAQPAVQYWMERVDAARAAAATRPSTAPSR
jgi:hypothetical protein